MCIFRTGGDWLITDMNRSKSVFQLFPKTLEQLEIDLEREGSDLAGVDAEFRYEELQTNPNNFFDNPIEHISNELSSTSIEVKKEVFETKSEINCPVASPFPLPRAIFLNGVQVIIAPYAAKYLYLALKDRIRHGKHFTFKNINTAITFVAESVDGTFCTQNNPFVVLGYWLQILIPIKLIRDMIDRFREVQNCDEIDERRIPIVFEWQSHRLKIVIDSIKPMENIDCVH